DLDGTRWQLFRHLVDAVLPDHEPVVDKLAPERGVVLVSGQQDFVDFLLGILPARFEPLKKLLENDYPLLPLRGDAFQSLAVEEVLQRLLACVKRSLLRRSGRFLAHIAKQVSVERVDLSLGLRRAGDDTGDG